MGIAAYNRASRVLRDRLDQESAARRITDAQLAKGYQQAKDNLSRARCLCGSAYDDSWSAGVHHGKHRCARVIARIA